MPSKKAKQSPRQNDEPNNERNLVRELAVEIVTRGEGDDQTTTVEASFSAETPVYEWGTWNESYQRLYRILDHSKSSVDMSRVLDGMCIEDRHYGDQIGLAEVAIVDRKLRGPIRFGASDRAEVIRKDAMSKIRRNLSIYGTVDPKSYKLEGEQDGIPVLRVMAWQPRSAAFVNVQADPAVGVGRELDTSQESGVPEKAFTTPNNKLTRSAKPMEEQKPEKTPEEIAAEAKREQDARSDDIIRMYALANMHKVDPKEVAEAIRENKSYGEFSDVVLAHVKEESTEEENQVARTVATVGLTDKEAKQFSIMRAIKSLQTGEACYEREVSDAIARKFNKPAAGIYIPHERLALRDLTTAGTGGSLVSTDLKTESFIDILRSTMVLTPLGVRMLGGLQGDIDIPKQTAAGTGYWVSEGVAPTESTQTLGQVSGRPHTAGAYTDITRRMLLQSSMEAEAFVQRDLAEVLARTIQTAAFAGSGNAGQPKGLVNADDINSGTITTPGSATWANILTFPGQCMVDNVSVEAGGAWVMRPLVWSSLAGIPKTTGEATFLAQTGPNVMAGFPYHITTAIPVKSLYFGIWANMVLAMWGGLDLTIDKAAGATAGTIRVIALQDVDILIRHGQAFAYNAAVIA